MNNRTGHRDGVLDDITALVLQHPGLRAKGGLGLVTDVLGPTDWITGPGDDAAAIRQPATDQETFLLAAGRGNLPAVRAGGPVRGGRRGGSGERERHRGHGRQASRHR